MRFLSRGLLVGASVALVVAGGSGTAEAAETANSDFVIIQPEDTVEDDLYVGALKVRVEGRIEGDLIAFAAEEVVIDGEVTGSVFAVTQKVTVNGSVGRSLRVAAQSLDVEGSVGRDIVAAVAEARLGDGSIVGGDVLLWALDVTALGSIGGDLTGSQGSLSLSGSVDGDVDLSVGRLTVVDALVVGGDLGYRSEGEAVGIDLAEVGGAVVHKEPLPANLRVRGIGLLTQILIVLLMVTAAVSIAYGWPERSGAAVEAVRAHPWRSYGWGALVMFSPFALAGVAALILALAQSAASFPLLVVLVPVGVALLGTVLMLSLVAGVPTVGRVGRAIRASLSLPGAVLLGSVITAFVWMLPWVGWAVPLVVLPLGLGGWIVGRRSGDAPDSLERSPVV